MSNILELITTGFKSWWKNLAIILPFLFNGTASSIVMIIGFLLALPILKISFLDLFKITDEATAEQFSQQLLSTLSNSSTLALLIILSVIIILVVFLINAYFTSGAIGMSNDYFKFKKIVSLKEMHENGKKFLGRHFSYQLITNIIFLAFLGIFFILMVILKYNVFSIVLFILAFIIVLVAGFFVSLTPYIFIIENSNLWPAFKKSFITVGNNFWPLLGLMVLWLLISSVISIIYLIPVIGQIIGPIANSFIITPASEFSYVLFCRERKN